ncbi:MAG: hypothetical protein WCA32_03625 [Chromatiaceae bacterium]
MNPRMNDRNILMLPHPVRVDAALEQPAENLMLAGTGLLEAIRPYLTEETATTEWIINTIPGMQELALVSLGVPGSFNMGTFVLMLARARLRAHGDPILEVASPLQTQLTATDLGAQLPVRFFRCPYPAVYIELARPSPLRIINRDSGLHEVEGAYVTTHRIPPNGRLNEKPERVRGLRLDPAKEARVLELVITGSPVGKDNVLDDASQDIVLYIQDEDEPLSALLARHNAYYRSAWVTRQPGFVLPQDDEMTRADEVIDLLAKVLLYLNLAEAEQVRVNARSDRERRLRGLGPKKAKRFARQLATAYDRILIGSRTETQTDTGSAGGSETPGSAPAHHLRPHWRRGHFRRIRYGEGLSESRLGWIQPVLVNAAEALGTVKTKTYAMR